jgi:hypothetical protein
LALNPAVNAPNIPCFKSPLANTWAQRAQNVIASYVVGGVVAELGGGKSVFSI